MHLKVDTGYCEKPLTQFVNMARLTNAERNRAVGMLQAGVPKLEIGVFQIRGYLLVLHFFKKSFDIAVFFLFPYLGSTLTFLTPILKRF